MNSHQYNPRVSSPTASMPPAKSGMAIAALVLGIIALLTSFLPIINNLSMILAVLGVVFGFVGVFGIKRGKKSGMGLAVASLVICVLSIAVVMATQAAFSNALDEATNPTVATDSATTDASSQSSDTASADDAQYVISGEELDTSNSYDAQIVGTLTNNSGKDLSYVQVEYTVHDADGNQIGTALANTNSLKAGGTWKFAASSLQPADEVASYERTGITAW